MGSPGVGKTTIYQQVSAEWKRRYHWIPGEKLYPEEKLIAASYRGSILNILRKLFLNRGKYDVTAVEEAGIRFVSANPEFIDICWNHINCTHKKNLNGTDLRFQKVSYLNKIIQKIQVISEQKCNQIALIDEGLIHLISSFLSSDELSIKDKTIIENFLNIVPIPYGLVSIQTDLEENTKRLLQRKKIMSKHKSLMKEQLEKIVHIDHQRREIINKEVIQRDTPILLLNSSDKISVNAHKIMNFAEKLSFGL